MTTLVGSDRSFAADPARQEDVRGDRAEHTGKFSHFPLIPVHEDYGTLVDANRVSILAGEAGGGP